MSLLFVDGVDYYGDGGLGRSGTSDSANLRDVNRKWTEANAGSGTGFLEIRRGSGRFGGDAFRFGAGSSGGNMRKTFVPNPTIIVGFAFKLSSGTEDFCEMEWLGNSPHAELVMEADNTISIHNANGNRVGGSADNGLAVNDDQWYYIEWKLTAGSSGSSVLHVNEEEWFNVTGQDFLNGSTAQINSIQFKEGGTSLSGVSWFLDDIYILDTNGSQNNDFLGDVKIDSLLVNADTVLEDWVALNGGDNFDEIDDLELDLDTTYNSSSTIGDVDRFEAQDIADTPNEIFAAVQSIAARKSESGTRGIKGHVVANSSTSTSVEDLLITDYLYSQFIYENDPSGVSWTRSTIDGAQFGYELSS